MHTLLCGCCGTWSLLEGRFGSICQFPHIYEIMVPKCGSMRKWIKSNPCKNSKVKEFVEVCQHREGPLGLEKNLCPRLKALNQYIDIAGRHIEQEH